MDREVRVLRPFKNFEVLYLKRDKLPIFYVNLLYYKGSVHELGYKRGIHNFVLKLLLEGPKGKSPVEFSMDLERRGLRLKTRSGYVVSSFEIDGLSEYFSEGIKEAYEIIVNPAFRLEDFVRLKEQYRTAVLLGFQDPEFVVSYFSNLFFFQGIEAFRALPDFGLIPEALKLDFEELKRYYEEIFKRAVLKLVVVSNLDVESKLQEISVLENIQSESKDFSIKGDIGNFEKIYIVNMKIQQAHLKLMKPAIGRNHPDYQALRIANFLIGASDLSSRLMKKLRVEEGLTYSVTSVFSPGIPVNGEVLTANLSIQCETEKNNARRAYDMILGEIRKVRSEGFTMDELSDAKAFFKGSIPLRVESYAQLLSMLTEEVLFGLPFFHWEEEIRDIERLKLEDVNKAAFDHFDFDKPFLLLVGDASRLEKDFKDFDIEVVDPWSYLGLKGISLFSLLRKIF